MKNTSEVKQHITIRQHISTSAVKQDMNILYELYNLLK